MKNAAALALVASLGAAGALGVRAALVPSMSETYFAHHIELDQRHAADGGTNVSGLRYLTVTTPLSDGGSKISDIGNILPWTLTESDQVCARTLLKSATP